MGLHLELIIINNNNDNCEEKIILVFVQLEYKPIHLFYEKEDNRKGNKIRMKKKKRA